LLEKKQAAKATPEVDLEKFDYKNEVMTFPTNCPNCHAPSQTRMVVVDIPFFKEVVIMALSCDSCGYKSNEVKAGGAIPPKGSRITLKITNPEDLSRNVLKSETATVRVPELQIVVGPGSLGGRFTTVEGLLVGIKDDIGANRFLSGDSSEEETKEKAKKFLERMDKVRLI
jgi:zinc finger protein